MSLERPLEARARLAEPGPKRALNVQLFAVVAPHYDAVTRWLSFDRDRVWKARLVAALPHLVAPVCLDLACGTGDLTFLLAARYPYGQITGLDLSEAMLDRARARTPSGRVSFRCGDMGRTGLASGSVDLVTGGYALRNAGDLAEALAEVHRLLKPGGWACFLDFSKPPGRFGQRVEGLVLKAWGALWGWVFHRDPEVYTYIAESLARFPDRLQLAALAEAQGFQVLSSTPHFLGIVQRLTLRKPGAP